MVNQQRVLMKTNNIKYMSFSVINIYENEELSTIAKITEHVLMVFENKLVAPIEGRSCFSVSTYGTHDAT